MSMGLVTAAVVVAGAVILGSAVTSLMMIRMMIEQNGRVIRLTDLVAKHAARIAHLEENCCSGPPPRLRWLREVPEPPK